MSKKDKLYERLARRPPPTDFRWDELVTLVKQCDFTATCTGGSHHVFQHTSGYTFAMSKTHPSGVLKMYQVKAALEAVNIAKRKRQ